MHEPDRINAGTRISSTQKDDQEICFRPWPCGECRSKYKRRDYLSERINASATIRGGFPDIDKEVEIEKRWLFDYINTCPHRDEETYIASKLTQGSEHVVFLREGTDEVIKLTKEGCYGESYFLDEDKMVCQANCSPIEYIVRMSLCRVFLGFKTDILGLTEKGQFVTSQKFIQGNIPLQSEVDEFLENSGFTDVKKSRWLWMTLDEEEKEIWLGDARADNFVINDSGIVPIDLRMWAFFDSK